MDIKTCANCQDKFVSSHDTYRPKFKLVSASEGPPTTIWYCSDACLAGIEKGKKAPCGCDVRRLMLNDLKDKEKWVCIPCAKVFA